MSQGSSKSTPSTSPLLTYTAPDPAEPSQPPIVKTQSKERLHVGGLHPTVDEYTLVQLFSRYGKITKLDYLFHKTGPMKGKPRGYAFIQYASHDSAEKAITACDGRLIRGRKITVSYASEAPQMEGRSSRMHEIDRSKVTTLSLLKSRRGPAGTEDKIAALEAKLKEIERSKDSVSTAALPQTGLDALPPRPPGLPPKPTS